jgi:hypothetical protein
VGSDTEEEKTAKREDPGKQTFEQHRSSSAGNQLLDAAEPDLVES